MHTTGSHATTKILAGLPFAGSSVAAVTVDAYATSFVFESRDGEAINLRVASFALISQGEQAPTTHEAGPPLGAVASSFVGLTCEGFVSEGLDLILDFGSHKVRVVADDSGYESYQITFREKTIVGLLPTTNTF
jgi:hypothetical protein